ncbi:MAG: hypothetical protein J7M34_00965 [Anaerolineae bacterium]|nr:hypothetical protein [Anaerolineae bacterium]
MHTIHTFILRLLIDTSQPDVLRGSVRCVSTAEEHAFASGDALLARLHQMVQGLEAGFPDPQADPPDDGA